MESNNGLKDHIGKRAIEFGADLVGFGKVEELKRSPTYEKYAQDPYYDFYKGLPPWPDDAKTLLVIAIRHPVIAPEMTM